VLTEVAAAVGVGVREERLTPEMLASMQECFLLSTTRDVMPVRAIDSVNFAVGEDTVAMKIKAAFARHARAYTQKHPELRMP
jgi:branched-chain amino acid aminotransferase